MSLGSLILTISPDRDRQFFRQEGHRDLRLALKVYLGHDRLSDYHLCFCRHYIYNFQINQGEQDNPVVPGVFFLLFHLRVLFQHDFCQDGRWQKENPSRLEEIDRRVANFFTQREKDRASIYGGVFKG